MVQAGWVGDWHQQLTTCIPKPVVITTISVLVQTNEQDVFNASTVLTKG